MSLAYPLWTRPTLALRREAGTGSPHRLRSIPALKQVSFDLRAGDRLALIGANGSGKTTLLKVLAGVFEPDRGSVCHEGRTDALFNISLGFRREATGRRNIELRGLINGWNRQEIAERMEEIIAFSELGEFIDLPMKTYSQGMAARLAFAAATSMVPDILLMDEWIGAGDAAFQKRAGERLESMMARAGIIVLASHNAEILRRSCGLGLVLDRGRVAFLGPLEEALEHHHPAMAG